MNETVSLNLETIPEKLAWLEERYWRFGQDDVLSGYLEDLFEVDDDGRMTSSPRCDPLTGETSGLMLLGGSGDGKTALLNWTCHGLMPLL